jgi:hypothetical protein
MTESPTTHSKAFLDMLAKFLVPYFGPLMNADMAAARQEALATVASYGGRTRAEMIHATRVIAYSLSGMTMLNAAVLPVPNMDDHLRLRIRICANAMNRSAQQDEKALAKRLACDRPGAAPSAAVGNATAPAAAVPTASAPDAAKPAAEPDHEMTDAMVAESLDFARARIDSYRARVHAAQSSPGTQKQPSQRPWGSKMPRDLAAAELAAGALPS